MGQCRRRLRGWLPAREFPAPPGGDRGAPSRPHAARGRPTAGRTATTGDGLRVPLAAPLASCPRPAATLAQARLVRVPGEGARAHALPPVAPARRGLVLVLNADPARVAVPHADALAPGGSASPWGGPPRTDGMAAQVRPHRAGPAPLGRPCRRRAPPPLRQHARVEPLRPVADDARVPHPSWSSAST